MGFKPSSYPGSIHHYSNVLHSHPVSSPSSTPAPPSPHPPLLFIGGLTDGLLTIPYAALLAQQLPPSYSLVEILLSSSYIGWGTSCLGKDCTEIAQCIAYLTDKKPGGKVVLMGHSTGCQDVIHYLVGPGAESRPPIAGAIIQASVSDREAMVDMISDVYDESLKVAKEMVREGKGEELMPYSVTGGFLRTPICARRWLSLASPEKNGEDDLFSSDLEDGQLQKTFGRLPARSPLCILYSEGDEFVPDTVDIEAMVKRWIGFVKRGGGVVDEEHSGVVKDATHNLKGNPDVVVQDLLKRVVGFIEKLEKGELDARKRASNDQSSL